MVQIQKPEKIDIIKDHGYGSEKSQRAAEAIEEHWEDAGRNLSEISRRSGIPNSTISKVYNEHMGPKGGNKTMEELRQEQKEKWNPDNAQSTTGKSPSDYDGVVPVEDVIEMVQESYRKGYQDGVRDTIDSN